MKDPFFLVFLFKLSVPFGSSQASKYISQSWSVSLILVSYDAGKIPTNTFPLHVTSPTQLAFLDFTTGLVVMLHSYI